MNRYESEHVKSLRKKFEDRLKTLTDEHKMLVAASPIRGSIEVEETYAAWEKYQQALADEAFFASHRRAGRG